jgi:hypothetical protein
MWACDPNVRQYFSANKQYFYLTINQHKPNFNETNSRLIYWQILLAAQKVTYLSPITSSL